MSTWSRYLFGASVAFGMAGIVFGERLPPWWGPVSIPLMTLAAAAFLIRSVIDYRRGGTPA